MQKRKPIKKSIWLPAVLTAYFLGMAIYFGPELIRNGETTRFITVSVIETAIIIGVHLFYRRRERNNP